MNKIPRLSISIILVISLIVLIKPASYTDKWGIPLWLGNALDFKIHLLIMAGLGGLVGGLMGLCLRDYKSLLISSQKMEQEGIGWKWSLFNDLFTLTMFTIFTTSAVLFIRILQEDRENIQSETLHYLNLFVPYFYVVGIWLGEHLNSSIRLRLRSLT